MHNSSKPDLSKGPSYTCDLCSDTASNFHLLQTALQQKKKPVNLQPLKKFNLIFLFGSTTELDIFSVTVHVLVKSVMRFLALMGQ